MEVVIDIASYVPSFSENETALILLRFQKHGQLSVMPIIETADRRSAGQKHCNIDQVFSALAIDLPAWGATIHSLNTLFERERISTRSAQMAKVLKQLVHRTEQARTPEETAAVISQAEELMLMENHEW